MNDNFKTDIYLCSTVRHLLLSLLRAIHYKNEAKIILIIDQQKLSPDDYDIATLPDYINIEFVNRKDIIKGFFKYPGRVKHKISLLTSVYGKINVLSSARLALSNIFENVSFTNSSLYLFNDRNRLSRIFRLAFPDYSLIEDGLANYIRKPISRYEVIRRKLQEGRVSTYKVVGDELQCSRIYLLNPSQADSSIMNKVSPIDFIFPEESRKFILSFFKCKDDGFYDSEVIIATQPISIDNYTSSGRDELVYKKIKDYLSIKGTNYSVKVHPRESSDRYKSIFDEKLFIEPKLPLEVLLLLTNKKPKIVSIYSTAGIGFESYCERYTLIRDDESDIQAQVFKDWDKNDALISGRIEKI